MANGYREHQVRPDCGIGETLRGVAGYAAVTGVAESVEAVKHDGKMISIAWSGFADEGQAAGLSADTEQMITFSRYAPGGFQWLAFSTL
jgi:hypothetical protein